MFPPFPSPPRWRSSTCPRWRKSSPRWSAPRNTDAPFSGIEPALDQTYTPQIIRPEVSPMPQYEYFCHACKKHFEKILTLAEHEEGSLKCPHCGSKKIEQSYAAFYAVT